MLENKGFQVLNDEAFTKFEHMVDSSIKRDIVIARRPRSKQTKTRGLQMNILISEDQFKAWKGKNVKDMDLGEWEAWALDFFHNKDFIKDPWLQITIRLDITEARKII